MRFRFLAPLMIVLALAGTALCDDTTDLKNQVRAMFDGYLSAIKKKDTKAAEKFIRANFTKDFQDTAANGQRMNLDQMIALQKQHIASIKKVNAATFSIDSVKAGAGKGSTTESFMLDAIIPDMKDPKKTAKLKVMSTWTANYKKVNGKWMCFSSKTKSEKVLVNGKPVGASAAAG